MMLTTRSLVLFTVLFTCRGDSTEGTGVAPPGDVAVLAAPGSEAIGSKAGDSQTAENTPEAEKAKFESKQSKDSSASATSAASAASAASPAVATPQLRARWGYGRHPGSWSPASNGRRPMPPKPLKPHAMGPRR